METIRALDVETRLRELLDRTAEGESFEITQQGRAVARLVPVNGRTSSQSERTNAINRLRSMRGMVRGMTKEEMIATIDEGRRF